MATAKEKKIKRHNLRFLARNIGMSFSRLKKKMSKRKLSLDQATSMPSDQLERMICDR